MRSLLFTLLIVLLFTLSTASAEPDFLICDPQIGVVSYNLDVDGVIERGIPAQADGSIRYDLTGMPVGPHIFKAQAVGQGGWPSSWSDPFHGTKPENPLNLRVSQE